VRPAPRALAALAATLLAAAGCGGSTAHKALSSSSSPSAHETTATAPSAHVTTPVAARLRVSTVLHLPVGVSRAVVVALGGRLLVLGGLAPGDSTTARVWSVEVSRRTTTSAGHLATAVHDASGAVLGGHVFVFGGGAATTVATVQEYSGGASHVVGALPQPRSDSSATVIGGTAYVVGGFDGRRMTRDVLATTDGMHFHAVAKLLVGVRYPAVVADGADLLVVGGALATTEGTVNGAQTTDIQQVDPRTGHVTVIGHVADPLAHAFGLTVDGVPCFAGGRVAGGAVRGIWALPHLRLLGRLPQAVSDAAAAVIGATTYVIGGEAAGPGEPVSSVVALRLS